MPTLTETRAAMAAKQAEIRAKMAELDTASPGQAALIEAQHDTLVAQFDVLAEREKLLLATEARSGHGAPAAYGSAGRAPGAERHQRREAIEAALLHRASPERNELTPAAREFRGASLLDLARDVLEAEGRFERGLSRSEVAQRALMTSTDFPLTLANVAAKTLRQSYEASPRTFTTFARRRDLKDFRPASMVQLSAAPQLLPLGEDGEFTRGSMSEGAESMSLRSYGRIVGITRKVILNDDLEAFTDLPARFGQSAATLESDIVWGMILANPVLKTDNVAVFNAGHNNMIGSGSGGVPSVVTLQAARTAMAKQKDLDGRTVLNLAPRYIVVPTELELQVAQLLYPIQATTTAAAVPESIRSLIPVSEPRLSLGANGQSGSATAWYLFADPSVAETVVYGGLDGQDGPYTETRQGFEIDGIEVKCRHDFGAAMVDFRGAYRNAGA